MQQEQPQYYRAVKASEKPNDGTYAVLSTDAPDHGIWRTFIAEGIWCFQSEYPRHTHYLEPIPTPDAALLRSALEKTLAKYDGYINNLEGYYQQEETDEPLYSGKQQLHCRIVDHRGFVGDIREALSQTGDGWIRVEDGLPEESKSVIAYHSTYKCQRTNHLRDGKWQRGVNGIYDDVTHWRPLPSPPQPTDKK